MTDLNNKTIEENYKNQASLIFYSAAVQAQINSSRDFDKALLNLSVVALGAITFLYLNDVKHESYLFIVFIATQLCFFVSILFNLMVHYKNTDYIGLLAQLTLTLNAEHAKKQEINKAETTLAIKLKCYDKIVYISFGLGSFLSVLFILL
tara:strand:+ start:355 stop:804 length:450 start_codon:yes stop_codon:yes gene_type:complete